MKRITDPGRMATYGIIGAIGFFGLTAQALLFRDFLAVFEGNELGIALFFCSWLLWVAIGAFLGRWRHRASDRVRHYFEFLPLLYLPAYVLQEWLIGNARGFADVKAYELFPLARMIPFALVANAPVSLCSGWFFTRACQWLSGRHSMPVAKVYLFESIGSVAGGLFVTVLLGVGVAGENVSLAAAAVPALALFLYRWRGRAYPSACIPLLAILALGLAGAGSSLERANLLRSWQRLLPAASYRGHFTTPQAQYLYGEYQGQMNVVARESVVDSIPNTEQASEVIALHLAQCPRAGKFLVIGPGSFSLCKRLLALPQVTAVTWLDPDPDYPANLLRVLPESLRAGVERIDIPAVDVRRHLAADNGKYDIIILNLPNITTLTLNRYVTREFFLLARKRLAESGVLGVRIAAGENYMGDELVNSGASVFHTLRSVFKNLTLKPGEETWLLASDGGELCALPAVLRDRFRALNGAAALYPPEGLMSLYLPDRIEYQMDYYRNAAARAPEALLLNTDDRPKALLHSLLFAARKAGMVWSPTAAIQSMTLSGMLLLPLAIGLYALLRYVYKTRPRGSARSTPVGGTAGSAYDDGFLVFSVGAVNMGMNLLLMFMYQSVHGSLFLNVGLIAAVFMLGLALGSLGSQRFLAAGDRRVSGFFLPLGLLVYAVSILAIPALPGELSQPVFVALFLISGVLGGIFVPIIAARWNLAGMPDTTAGALIEFHDHLGGMCGGLIIGLVLLPVFGSTYALGAMALCLLVNLLLGWVRDRGAPVAGDWFQRGARLAGYLMFGLGVFLLAAALLFRASDRDALRRAFNASAESMCGGLEHVAQSQALQGGRVLDYWVLRDTAGTNQAYIYSTEKLASGARGYGGPVTLAIRMSAQGVLEDFRIIESNETPAYLDALSAWFRRLVGQRLFGPDLDGVDAVTGATLSSAAIKRTLQESGTAFAREVLHLAGDHAVPENRTGGGISWRFLYFGGLAVAALVLRIRPSRLWRRVFLLLIVVSAGLVLNLQYSMTHVFSLVSLRLPSPGWNDAFLLGALLPLFVLAFGNVYCGYLCPFGALQELIGDLSPAFLHGDPERRIWRYGRFVKFVMLLAWVVWFATTLSPALASDDPLTTVFGQSRPPFVVTLVVAVLGLSLVFGRFWCRNLCPVGAFLSLGNGLHLAKRFIPNVLPAACVFGVEHRRELDCLCCDRCRMPSRQGQDKPMGIRRRHALFSLAVMMVAFFVARKGMETWRNEGDRTGTAGAGVVAGGRASDADIRRIKILIDRHSLSGHKASHYRTIGSQSNP